MNTIIFHLITSRTVFLSNNKNKKHDKQIEKETLLIIAKERHTQLTFPNKINSRTFELNRNTFDVEQNKKQSENRRDREVEKLFIYIKYGEKAS